MYLEERFEGMSKLMNAQFNTVHDKLDAIEKQTTQTNGRVNDLEDNLIKLENDFKSHPINCPQSEPIKKISEKLFAEEIIKNEKKINWSKVMALIAIMSLIFTIYVSVRSNRKIDNFGVPVVTNLRGDFVALPDSSVVRFFPNDSMYIIKRIR